MLQKALLSSNVVLLTLGLVVVTDTICNFNGLPACSSKFYLAESA